MLSCLCETCRDSLGQNMETKRLKRKVGALIDNYIGLKLREKSFDPMGTGTSTIIDDLAQYDLAVSVALWWLNRNQGRDELHVDVIRPSNKLGVSQYPNCLEREALILSSFAGILMSSLPMEEILGLYRSKPVASYPDHVSKGSIVHPFTLSYHPLAMLGSYKAVHHSKKHNLKLKRWLSEREKTTAPPGRVSTQSSSQSFLFDSKGQQETPELCKPSPESSDD